jgi:hypothetical protein
MLVNINCYSFSASPNKVQLVYQYSISMLVYIQTLHCIKSLFEIVLVQYVLQVGIVQTLGACTSWYSRKQQVEFLLAALYNKRNT